VVCSRQPLREAHIERSTGMAWLTFTNGHHEGLHWLVGFWVALVCEHWRTRLLSRRSYRRIIDNNNSNETTFGNKAAGR
jgi:hypothetical protein